MSRTNIRADNSATFVGIQKFHEEQEQILVEIDDPSPESKSKAVKGVYKALALANPTEEQRAEAFKLAAEARFVEGRNDDAIDLFREAELLYGKINKSHFGRRTVLGRIGDVYLKNEDYELALDYYVKTLAMTQKVLGNDHHLVECQRAAIDSLRSQLYFDGKEQPKKILVESRQDRANAVNLQVEKVTREWRQSLGDDHPDVLTTLKSMGDIYFRGEEYDEALKNYTEFLRICRSVKNNTHPDIIPAIINIGSVHLSNGDTSKAIDFYREALRLKESMIGRKSCGAIFAHLANAHYEKGDLVEAKSLYQEALRFTKDEKGSGHPEVADLLMKIGSVNEENGNTEKAMKLYRGALGIRESYYGPNHASVAESMNSIGSVHYSRKENHMALRAYLAALRLTKEIFGEDHVQCADILVNIGNVHLQADELDEAIVTYYKALRCTLSEFGKEHEKVADILNNIGVTYERNEEKDLALDAFTEALRVYKTIGMPDSHNSVMAVVRNIRGLRQGSLLDFLVDEIVGACNIDTRSINAVTNIIHEQGTPKTGIGLDVIGETARDLKKTVEAGAKALTPDNNSNIGLMLSRSLTFDDKHLQEILN